MNTDIQSPPFFIAKEARTYPAGRGVTRQFIGFDSSIMMLKVTFQQGARGEMHSHPHAQTTYVVSGLFEFTIGDDTRLVGPGDGLFMEPDVSHSCVCLEKGELIDVFSPVREDFLETLD